MTYDSTTHKHPEPAVEMTALSDELRHLVELADGKPMSVATMLDELKDRGHAMFIIIIIWPFLLLPTTFGLSAPMGFAVAIIGLCVFAGRKPWLPAFLLRKVFPFEMLERVVARATRFAQWVEKVARPRFGFMLWPVMINFVGLGLVLWGLLMALPGPNNVFAAMILLYAFGLLMRDGLLILLAHALTLVSPVLVYVFWDEIVGLVVATWEKAVALLGM